MSQEIIGGIIVSCISLIKRWGLRSDGVWARPLIWLKHHIHLSCAGTREVFTNNFSLTLVLVPA